MITPIKTMTINQIAEREDDLLMSEDDIEGMVKHVRIKAIDEFAEKIFEVCKYIPKSYVMALAEQMKAGGEK